MKICFVYITTVGKSHCLCFNNVLLMSYWSGKFESVNIIQLPNWILPHESVMYRTVSKPAELARSAVSVAPPVWDAAAVWEAFMWDHWCDDETPPAWTTNSLKFCSRQAHYAALVFLFFFYMELGLGQGHEGQGFWDKLPKWTEFSFVCEKTLQHLLIHISLFVKRSTFSGSCFSDSEMFCF